MNKLLANSKPKHFNKSTKSGAWCLNTGRKERLVEIPGNNFCPTWCSLHPLIAPPHHSPPCPPRYWVAWPMGSSLPCRHAVPPGPWSGPSWTGLSLLMRNGELHSLSINGSQFLSVGMRAAVAQRNDSWELSVIFEEGMNDQNCPSIVPDRKEEETSHPKTKFCIHQRKICDSNASEISINTRDCPVKFFRDEDPVVWQCLF